MSSMTVEGENSLDPSTNTTEFDDQLDGHDDSLVNILEEDEESERCRNTTNDGQDDEVDELDENQKRSAEDLPEMVVRKT
jgi:hypothetical protein